MIALDTHIWFYFVNSGTEEFSAEAQKAISDNEVLGVSIISCWEIAMLVAKERLRLSIDVQDWITPVEVDFNIMPLFRVLVAAVVLSTPNTGNADPSMVNLPAP